MRRLWIGLMLGIVLVATLALIGAAASVTVELWTPDNPKWIAEAIALFEQKNPDVKVNHTYYNWDNIVEKVTVAICAGAPPDLFTYGTGGVVNFAEPGLIQPVDNIVSNALLKDMWPGFLEPAKWKGKLYGIPFVGATSALLYSGQLYEESGLDPRNPPTAWEDLIAKARKLVRRGSDGKLKVTGYWLPMTGNVEHVFTTFLRQLGGQFYTDDETKAAFNSTIGLEALEFYDRLVNQEGIMDVTSPIDGSSMLRGQIAMAWVGAPDTLARMRATDPDLAAVWKGALMPHFKKQLYWTGGQTFMIPVGAKAPEAAARFVNFITGPEVAPLAASQYYYFPRQSLLKSVYAKADPDLRTLISAFEFASTSPPHPQWVKTIPEMRIHVIRALRRQTTPKEALDTLCRIVNSFIAESKGV